MKQTILAISLVSLALLAAGCNKPTFSSPTAPAVAEQDKKMVGKMEDKESTDTETPTTTRGEYKTYSPDTARAEQAAGHKVVLFFHADWCPFCVEADKQFKAKLDQIPKGVTVLKTNYDTETALKKKYVVTYQHTFVQIDANGNLVSKWNGGDVDSLTKYLK